MSTRGPLAPPRTSPPKAKPSTEPRTSTTVAAKAWSGRRKRAGPALLARAQLSRLGARWPGVPRTVPALPGTSMGSRGTLLESLRLRSLHPRPIRNPRGGARVGGEMTFSLDETFQPARPHPRPLTSGFGLLRAQVRQLQRSQLCRGGGARPWRPGLRTWRACEERRSGGRCGFVAGLAAGGPAGRVGTCPHRGQNWAPPEP